MKRILLEVTNKMQKGYGQFIIEIINKTEAGTPIFTHEITDLLIHEFKIDSIHAKKSLIQI